MDGPTSWHEILNVIGVFFAIGIAIGLMGNGIVYFILSNRIGDKLESINKSLDEMKADIKTLYNRNDGRLCEAHLARLDGYEKRLDGFERRIDANRKDLDDNTRRISLIEESK